MAAIYPDSKTFVDKKLKYNEAEILSKYEDLKRSITKDDNMHHILTQFVDENFEDGDELEVWVPPDFTSNPSIADRIVDPEYKQWALDLNEVWKTLARKIKDDVKNRPELYSLIWVRIFFVNFQLESYFFHSIRGMQASNMVYFNHFELVFLEMCEGQGWSRPYTWRTFNCDLYLGEKSTSKAFIRF